MLVLSKVLHQKNQVAYIRFSKVGYFQSGTIFEQFTQKLNAKKVLKAYFIILIRAAKLVNEKLIRIQALEY